MQFCIQTESDSTYNRRQNELRPSPKTGLFYVLLTSNGGNIAFPPPSPPYNVVPMFELPIENYKHPNFEWRGQGGGGFFCSPKLPYLSTMSQQFCRRLSELQKWPCVLKKIN